MEVDKIMIVAHPDDEMLWGGANILSQPGWFVVCATNASQMEPKDMKNKNFKFKNDVIIGPDRDVEFFKTMSNANVTHCEIYDVPDDPSLEDDPTDAEVDLLFDGSEFEKELERFAKEKWNLIVTHNAEGEYGHPHHKKVHRMVMKIFDGQKDNIHTFGKKGEKQLSPYDIQDKREALKYYKSQDITMKLCHHEAIGLKYAYSFLNEPMLVEKTKTIPKLIHQIWFGKPLEAGVRKTLMDNNKTIAESNGFVYKLWGNDDYNEETLPLTWEYIQDATKEGERIGKARNPPVGNVRWAQIVDLARYEILHRFGGVYLDSIFEISKEFCDYIAQNNKRHLIVSNEDPCGLDCEDGDENLYMSNGFFACVPGCEPLHRILTPKSLNKINFENPFVNHTTGPYFFRTGINRRDDVLIIPTDKIYPYWISDTAYRKKDPPTKCSDPDEGTVEIGCFKREYPNSLAMYHHGFGGTWSYTDEELAAWKAKEEAAEEGSEEGSEDGESETDE